MRKVLTGALLLLVAGCSGRSTDELVGQLKAKNTAARTAVALTPAVGNSRGNITVGSPVGYSLTCGASVSIASYARSRRNLSSSVANTSQPRAASTRVSCCIKPAPESRSTPSACRTSNNASARSCDWVSLDGGRTEAKA